MFPSSLPQTVAQVPEEKRTVFAIPKQNFIKFEAEIQKLSKKSVKAGGWEINAMVIGYKTDKVTQKTTYEVWLDAPDVRIDGYRFIARLDHSQETGNIVRMVPNIDAELPETYRSVAPNCDHCNIRRIRRDTFVIQNVETGEFKQVGSTCLQGFFQTDPRAVARMAELLGYAREAAHAAEREPVDSTHRTFTLRDERYIHLGDYLEHTAAMIRKHGWVSGKIAYEQRITATRQRAYLNMMGYEGEPEPILDEDRKLAADALAWAQGLRDKETLSDYEHNVLVVAEASYIEGRAAGLAASIVGVYFRNAAKRRNERLAAINIADMSGLIALFEVAGSRLINPRIDISFNEVGTLTLNMAKPGHAVPGSLNVKNGRDWLGRIHRDGRFEPNRRIMLPNGLEPALKQFAAEPAKVAAEHGHKTGRCCFCRLPLTDARSLKVGYGAICASNYELPYPTMAELAEAC